MSKIDPLVSVSGGLTTAATLNVNFQAIEDAFQNTLSLDGSTPNEMAADLSLGHNRLINVADAVEATDAINLSQLQELLTDDPGAANLRIDLANPAAGFGADLVGFTPAGTGSELRTLEERGQDTVGPFDKVPAAQIAAIKAGTSTYDVGADINTLSTDGFRIDLPEGRWSTSVAVQATHGIKGKGPRRTSVRGSNANVNVVELPATTADFCEVSDLLVLHDSVGTGDGIVLKDTNNNVQVNRCNVQKARRGFSSELVAFMQSYNQCRADFCDTGFYAQGFNGVGAGAGTTLIYNQAYVSNGNGAGSKGWDVNNMRTAEFLQPTTDMSGLSNAIVCTGVGQVNIYGHHFEGTPAGNGSYITYSTSGSLSAGLCVIGGALEIADLSALTYNYLNIQANDDTVRVVLIGVNVRNLTGGAGARLAKLSGQAASHIEIIAINCDFGALDDLFDTSALSGTYSYRKLETESGVVAHGQTSVAGGATISTGITNTDARSVFVQVRLDAGAIPTVMAHVTQTFTLSDTVQVRFTKLSDGTEDFGTYNVQWQVI